MTRFLMTRSLIRLGLPSTFSRREKGFLFTNSLFNFLNCALTDPSRISSPTLMIIPPVFFIYHIFNHHFFGEVSFFNEFSMLLVASGRFFPLSLFQPPRSHFFIIISANFSMILCILYLTISFNCWANFVTTAEISCSDFHQSVQKVSANIVWCWFSWLFDRLANKLTVFFAGHFSLITLPVAPQPAQPPALSLLGTSGFFPILSFWRYRKYFFRLDLLLWWSLPCFLPHRFSFGHNFLRCFSRFNQDIFFFLRDFRQFLMCFLWILKSLVYLFGAVIHEFHHWP